jgi:hypothetical protein
MTDCILEAINSSMQAYIIALTGRLCPSISRLQHNQPLSHSVATNMTCTEFHCQFVVGVIFLDNGNPEVLATKSPLPALVTEHRPGVSKT